MEIISPMFMTFNKNYMETICSYMRKSHNKVSIIKKGSLGIINNIFKGHFI